MYMYKILKQNNFKKLNETQQNIHGKWNQEYHIEYKVIQPRDILRGKKTDAVNEDANYINFKN